MGVSSLEWTLPTEYILRRPWLVNVDIRSLSQKLKAAVYLDNEAMCSAFCENWLGICRGVEDFVCINIESGIGAGIFVRGKIYRGYTGSAGEVGHISVDENGPRCKCGNAGCLETMASINAMAEKYREMMSKTNPGISGNTIDQNFEALLRVPLRETAYAWRSSKRPP